METEPVPEPSEVSVPVVKGTLSWSVSVDCPHCNESLDLAEIDDDDYPLAGAVFGSMTGPGDWDNVGIEFACPKCGKEFTLGKIEY